MLLILRERASVPTGLPARLLQVWNEKIATLESLAEEKQLKNLKPADIFFELTETCLSGDAMSKGTSSTPYSPTDSHASHLLMYCYCHDDTALRGALEKHLSALRHDRSIVGWHDRKIVAGGAWETEIDKRLDAAEIFCCW